jgi:hypothetical protein
MSTYSRVGSKNVINQDIEMKLNIAEGILSAGGRIFGVSLLTGAVRIAFGCAEAVGAVVYSILKLLQGAIRGLTSQKAKRSFQEGLVALLYVPHGVANIFRGFLEMCQIGVVNDLDDCSMQYPHKSESRAIASGYESDEPTTDLRRKDSL